MRTMVMMVACISIFFVGIRFAASSQAFVVHTVGAPEVVFDTTKQACERMDIPDANARAFRDQRNQVHLFASHFIWRAFVGPTLNTVKRDCRVVYDSDKDPDPAHFKDYNWLGSVFTLNGLDVAALTHDEYHGWAYAGMCLKPAVGHVLGHCWWNSIGFAESDDGGTTFKSPNPPSNFVASVPAPYDPETSAGATGYYSPTNIVQSGSFYYAMINAWSNPTQRHGACLIRTASVFNPSSWRAWDGHSFTVNFVDPYLHGASPDLHTCAPVYLGTAQSLVFHKSSGDFVLSELAPDRRYGAPGFYVSQSRDLLHWDRPVLVISMTDLQASGGLRHARYDYFSLLDPDAPDRNFSIITDRPYVYYVQLDLDHAPLTRKLMRQQLQLSYSGSPK